MRPDLGVCCRRVGSTRSGPYHCILCWPRQRDPHCRQRHTDQGNGAQRLAEERPGDQGGARRASINICRNQIIQSELGLCYVDPAQRWVIDRNRTDVWNLPGPRSTTELRSPRPQGAYQDPPRSFLRERVAGLSVLAPSAGKPGVGAVTHLGMCESPLLSEVFSVLRTMVQARLINSRIILCPVMSRALKTSRRSTT